MAFGLVEWEVWEEGESWEAARRLPGILIIAEQAEYDVKPNGRPGFVAGRPVWYQDSTS
ncbi:MAG TPA: hypothetical protein VMF06_04905 [Candidatus Limnocylindria bacterium]|jgi:hypothetical protein|nr:hypothetical protein [Candidatus Limnocylindria bacterium]